MSLEHNGRSQSIAAWARELGVDPKTISWRLANGWTVAAALSTPAKQRKVAKRASAKSADDVATVATVAAPATLGRRSAPAALLEAAGYKVRSEARAPNGLAIFVDVPEVPT
jgi:hypothetical protein